MWSTVRRTMRGTSEHGDVEASHEPRCHGATRRAAVTALAMLVGLAAASEANARTIVGGPGPDRLVATSAGGDTLYGAGGADTLIGGPGGDRLYGGRAGNTIRAGAGNNYVEGGSGNDVITAQNGNNTIYSGTGHDRITVGDGNNYIDVGEARDTVVAGHGDNIVHTGSGGGSFRLGNGNNLVFFGSGDADISLGSGVNVVFVNSGSAVRNVDCGGNPQSVIYVNPRGASGGSNNASAIAAGRIRRCANIIEQPAPPIPNRGITVIKRGHAPFDMRGTAGGDDKLLGNHGGGRIDGRGGDNVLWADHQSASGGERARSRTTRITAQNGDNEIYGGRGHTIIDVGTGDNVIRGGEGSNRITTRGGSNIIRLQGKRSNVVTIIRGGSYVESFANGSTAPIIRCRSGARATIVHARLRPTTDCRGIRASAYTEAGRRQSLKGISRIKDSPSAIAGRPRPGEAGVGVPRPPLP